MVQIRHLKPTVKIRMPTDRSRGNAYRPSQVVVVRRTNHDFPPPTPQPTPCRLWQGTKGSDGYGWRKITLPDGTRKSRSMHRWVMEQYLGRDLKSHEIVLHACDQPLCYRLEHLSLGTIIDNNRDMKRKGRNSPPPVNRFPGEAHPMAKLSYSQVSLIRARHAYGDDVATLAERYNVSPTTIRRIIHRVTWTVGEEGDPTLEKP